ncbi:hypothetical protein DID88_002446 [Monilinia fructigena]|uniref:Ubiquinone biosynthesis protein n=1 Tax=Monilinia fructigena TaxID=38457 RepID=A0A395INU3_9HELO|nr:hypothetical protein DID88_002446 [Monilinia fructigena]
MKEWTKDNRQGIYTKQNDQREKDGELHQLLLTCLLTTAKILHSRGSAAVNNNLGNGRSYRYHSRGQVKAEYPVVRATVETEGGALPKGVGKRVKALTWERLLGNKDVIHRWQEAQTLLTLPTNLSTSLHELHALSDEIWFLSGDTSVDSSWYTKRVSLSAIYAATELFMTTDKSSGFKRYAGVFGEEV